MSSLPLSYLFAHPDAVGVSVRHPAALLLLLLVPWLLLWAPAGTTRRRLAATCRGSAFVLLVLTLAGVALTAGLPDNRLSLIAAVDVSESIDAEGRRWEERYLAEVAAALAPDDELGVVAFGRDAQVLSPPGAPHVVRIDDTAVSRSATDVGRGLEAAMALFGADTEHRLLLISDGNETRGTSLAKLARAQRAAVTIYAAVPPHTRAPDVAVDKLTVSPLVAEDSVFPVRVVLRNPVKQRPATLRFLVDGTAVGTQKLELLPGTNAVEIPYRLHGLGSHELRAEVATADDPIAGNNYRRASVMVGGKLRVLRVSTRPHSPLARVLERKEISITTVVPADFPTQIDDLLSYHCVVFEDVSAASFTPRRLEMLERYVNEFGGGFILAAGERTYGDSGFKKTPLERLLPVTLEPRRPPRPEREPLALFILIDRSNSMGYHIVDRTRRSDVDSKLAYAKRAALAVVGQLKDTDMVGLIAFDSQPFEVSTLQALKENRSTLEEDIPRLQPGGGTDFYDALESARKQLIESRINTKHVILLTDGDTNRGAADHYPLIAALERAGISVTTIRIGDDTVNLTLLHDISSRTGGQFYHVENVEMLPELLLKDTTQALAQTPQHADTFAPQVAGVSQVLHGLKAHDLPLLRGYAYARQKPGADLLLYVLAHEKRDPLLAAWQYGLGRVVSFTASISDDAETWAGWEGFGKLWSQLLHWTAREQTARDYAFEVHRVDGQATLTVHAFDDLDDGYLQARLLATPEQGIDVPLVPRAPRQFVGRLPAVAAGRYAMTITKRSATRSVQQRSEVIVIPDRDEEPQEEFERDQPNWAVLQGLTAGTGGAIDAPVRTVVERRPGTRRIDHPLDWLFIPGAMLLFLADVAARRLATAG